MPRCDPRPCHVLILMHRPSKHIQTPRTGFTHKEGTRIMWSQRHTGEIRATLRVVGEQVRRLASAGTWMCVARTRQQCRYWILNEATETPHIAPRAALHAVSPHSTCTKQILFNKLQINRSALVGLPYCSICLLRSSHEIDFNSESKLRCAYLGKARELGGRRNKGMRVNNVSTVYQYRNVFEDINFECGIQLWGISLVCQAFERTASHVEFDAIEHVPCFSEIFRWKQYKVFL